MGVFHENAYVRIVRGRLTTGDTAWASDSGHVLVHWPAGDSIADWQPRPTIDAIGGVGSSTGTLIGRFPRVWTLRGPAVARWADGAPAAVAHAVGRGCIRDVGIVFDPASDITLRPPFRQFARRLLEPCGGSSRVGRIDSTVLGSLAGGTRFPHIAAMSALRQQASEPSPWTPWLLGLGALLLLVELAVRRLDRRLV
jgi:hypothetical protein